MIKISIVVPVYNVELYVERCLISCIHQDISPEEYEIIVVNDGTKDNSLAIVNRIATKYKHIKVISQENQGLGGARNTGLLNASGEYVWFIDSDDWIEENCLGRLYNKCVRLDLDVLRIGAYYVSGNNCSSYLHFTECDEVMNGIDVLSGPFEFGAPFAIYKRRLLIDNKLFFLPGVLHEDNELTPRLYYFANRVATISGEYYFIFQNLNSITRTVNPKKSLDCIIVMNSLHQFQKTRIKKGRNPFHKVIGGTLNVALNDACSLEYRDVETFSSKMHKNKHLYYHLIKSDSIIYAIEGFFMILFPKQPVLIYKLLNVFNRRA